MIKLNIVSDPHGYFKRILGVIFILVGIGIITGYDKKLQTSILDAGFFDVTRIEQKFLDSTEDQNTTIDQSDSQNVADQTVDNNTEKTGNNNFLTLEQKKGKFTLAPDLSTIDGYINTDGQPISISEFKGKKVVLLDIWTYSCINCQRTIPYLNDWYKKYEDKGLVIIGLHTPEFSFERVQKNVEEAVAQFGIKYPVVLDNDFSTWNAYHNRYWPRKYLIDIDGYMVYDHAGEGEYPETEHAIQDALKERIYKLGMKEVIPESISNPVDKIEVSQNKVNSPEIYFGGARNEYLANGSIGFLGVQNLVLPDTFKTNRLYLGGTWDFNSEYAENSGGGTILFQYQAKNVYMVANSVKGAQVEVYVDNKLVKTIFIKNEMLYNLVEGSDYGAHTLRLKIKDPGIKAFAFTFG